MIETFTFKSMSGGQFHGQAALRKKAFVDAMGWDVPTHEDMEFDEFDTPRAHYVLVRGDEGRAVSTLRLLPTKTPYMLEMLWPDWVAGEIPRSQTIYEVSRYVVDPALKGEAWQRAHAELVVGYMQLLKEIGGNQAIFFGAYKMLEQGLKGGDVKFEALGPTLELNGAPHVAIITEPLTDRHLDSWKARL